MLVQVGDFITKGQQIGTIGDAHGSYLAHLHLEIREDVDLPIGGGYASDKTGYLDPTSFIKCLRKRRARTQVHGRLKSKVQGTNPNRQSAPLRSRFHLPTR